MKRKTIATLLTALTLLVSLSACGSAPASSNNSDDARIAELEKELAELKANQNGTDNTTSNESAKEEEIESWTDDTIIAFTDEKMLKKSEKLQA